MGALIETLVAACCV